jgi:hypothetical protein
VTTAVVTRAGRGLGRAIALRLARDGHAVAVNEYSQLITLGRVETPEDVAAFVSYLA